MKLTLNQLGLAIKQLHLLTDSGCSLYEGLNRIRKHTDSATFLPISRIILDLEEGLCLADTIRENTYYLPEELYLALKQIRTEQQFYEFAPQFENYIT